MDSVDLDLDIFRELCNNKAVKWTAHALERLQERGIEPSDVRHCIAAGKIVEHYPSSYPYPSCLMLGHTIAGKTLHVVAGIGEGYVWIVTAYYPNPDEWENNFSCRKER